MGEIPDQVALGSRFYREAAGVVALYIIDTPAAIRLSQKASVGDATARRVMRNIGAWAARAFLPEVPEPGKPRCVACDYLFKNEAEPAALVVTTPMLDGEWAVTAGMCRKCADSGATGKATDAWKRQWPTSVVVPVIC